MLRVHTFQLIVMPLDRVLFGYSSLFSIFFFVFYFFVFGVACAKSLQITESLLSSYPLSLAASYLRHSLRDSARFRGASIDRVWLHRLSVSIFCICVQQFSCLSHLKTFKWSVRDFTSSCLRCVSCYNPPDMLKSWFCWFLKAAFIWARH